MKVLKGALLLLLLAVANAKPDHHHNHDHDHDHNHDHGHNHTDQKPADSDHCQVLKMLARDDLQQILGDWVLVRYVSEYQRGHDIMKNLSISRAEMRLQEDNQTLMFIERNRFSDNTFNNYYINMSMELLNNPNQTMHPTKAKTEVDGVFVPSNETGIVNFYETCPNCMMMGFKELLGNYLLNYRKEGHHQDVDHMKADHDTHRKMAECLGIDDDQPYIYDGVAEWTTGLFAVAVSCSSSSSITACGSSPSDRSMSESPSMILLRILSGSVTRWRCSDVTRLLCPNKKTAA
ncbi:hypothetical protein JOQ06_024654 [Pogonophryne albipinna]|uniref:Uncharacterized protein n=1 Tax=Pogonophryne albipinna TaxID=1090488 RepID=A0AAD6ABA3_9TELE|nr:hypothetical protein JOQ06_024654 [Pogonophryne albipinna]